VDAVSVYPTYRKPFDLIFNRVQTKDWLPGPYGLRTLSFEFAIRFRKERVSFRGLGESDLSDNGYVYQASLRMSARVKYSF
jgi:hypothetical protein